MLPILAVFTDQSTDYEQTAPMKRMLMPYGETEADVTGDLKQQAGGNDNLNRVKRRVQ